MGLNLAASLTEDQVRCRRIFEILNEKLNIEEGLRPEI